MKDFKFNIGSQSYTASVAEESEGVLEVVINGKTYHVEVPVQQVASRPQVNKTAVAPAAAPAAPRQSSASVAGSVSAPLPGTITKVLVAEGACVKKGDVLVVMEAMKMANDIVAESDGTVGKIHVTAGQSVNQGDVLVDFVGDAAPVAAPAPVQAVATPAPASAPAAPAPAVSASTVTAPLPGTISNILVKVGDTVKAGDTVLTMEAMKMENNITAEFGGTVKSVLVQQGQQVQGGAALVEIG